jgi:hypothetical protein
VNSEELQARRQALVQQLTPEFLSTLCEAARVVGWSVDAVETAAFVHAVHALAGVEIEREATEPYQED